MGDERIAVLVKDRRNKKDGLGLIITLDMGSTYQIDDKKYSVIAKKKFEDASDLTTLAKSFAEQYPGSINWNNPLENCNAPVSALRYPLSFEYFLVGVFDHYFSNLKS